MTFDDITMREPTICPGAMHTHGVVHIRCKVLTIIAMTCSRALTSCWCYRTVGLHALRFDTGWELPNLEGPSRRLQDWSLCDKTQLPQSRTFTKLGNCGIMCDMFAPCCTCRMLAMNCLVAPNLDATRGGDRFGWST